MKKAQEVEFEVLPKDSQRPSLQGDDPLIAFVARLMDTVFSIPGTRIRFGLDPIIGLLPGFGDTATALVSALLIVQSARYGVPRVVMARMALNVLLNSALGTVPVAGDLFSVWFKSNIKNYDLLRRHAGARRVSTAKDWAFIIALLGGLLALIVLLVIGAITVGNKLLSS
jgi:Domain of unknown function (DUF4112)